jgi:hypothetical protein
MGKSAKLQNWPPSENLREKNRILLFRGAVCLQLAIAVLTVGLLLDFSVFHSLSDHLPEKFARFVEMLIDLFVMAGVFCPVFVLWTIVRAPFGLFRKTAWILVTVVLFALQIFAMLSMVQ